MLSSIDCWSGTELSINLRPYFARGYGTFQTKTSSPVG
uniref:Uncharacterized protein n=1 Tax=Arundo donax TaxID=35708 RepID=A0A0A9DUL2_ARUDO